MVDEPRDVAVHVCIAAQSAIHAKHPDTAVAQIAIFAAFTLFVGDQLSRVVDDALVLVDGLEGEQAKAMKLVTTPTDLRKDWITRHNRTGTLATVVSCQLSVQRSPLN